MTKVTTDPNRKWLKANATAEEFMAAFKAYSETQWGMPTFQEIRQIVIARRSRAASLTKPLAQNAT